MTQLFGRERSVITKHVRNVFNDGELDEKSNVQNLHLPHSDKPVRFYNLDVIISVGYLKKIQQHAHVNIDDAATDALLTSNKFRSAPSPRTTSWRSTRPARRH